MEITTSLLQDETFIEFVNKCIDDYFDHNKEETTASIRWEAFKAYIRGEIISFSSIRNEKCNMEIILMEQQMKTLENEYYGTNNPEILKKLRTMRAKYDKLTAEKVAKSLDKTNILRPGRKRGKLLAWRIKKM